MMVPFVYTLHNLPGRHYINKKATIFGRLTATLPRGRDYPLFILKSSPPF
jgi:hypothetical protein